MGLRHSSPSSPTNAHVACPSREQQQQPDPSRFGPSEEDLSTFPALARACKIVAPEPISCFSDFWQVSLSDLTSSLTSYDAESMSALLEGLCEQIVVNTAYSDNLRSLIIVLCMSLEQYPQVLLHQQALAIAAVPAQEAGRGSLVPPSAYLQTEEASKTPPPEKVHELFQRLYGIQPLSARRPAEVHRHHHTHSMYPISSIETMTTLPTPEWLLNLTFFARLFLQYICQLEYGDRKKQLLSLRPIKWMIEQELAHKHAHPHKPFELPPSSLHQDLAYRLTHTLMSAMADMPLTPATHELHSEMAGLFLALCSTQVYLPLSPLYAQDNLFLSHALQGPIKRRAKVIMNKWMRNVVQCTRRAKQEDASSEEGTSSSPPAVSEPSPAPTNDPTSVAVRITDPLSPVPVSPTLSQSLSPSPSPSPSPPTAEVRSLLPHPMSHLPGHPPPPMSLRAKLTQLVGMAAQHSVANNVISSGNQPHPTLLKRLGSRLFAILFFPMKLYHYFFDHLSQSGENDLARSLMLDPLSIRSTVCVLLMQHQNLDSFRTQVDTVIEDADGVTRTITYVHDGEKEFDSRGWSDESVVEDVEGEYLRADSASASSSRSNSPAPPVNVNPYRHVLASMMDADEVDEDEDVAPVDAASVPRSSLHEQHHEFRARQFLSSPSPSTSRTSFTVSFPSLYEIFVTSSTNEFSTLLLYSLLHSSPSFRNYLLVKSDIDRLIMPWLELLYSHAEGNSSAASTSNDSSSTSGLARVAAKKQQLITQKFLGLNMNSGENETDSPSRPSSHMEDVSDSVRNNRIYMLLIMMLMLSSDKSFVQTAHTRYIVNRVPFYSEARLNHISLGSVIILVFIKLIQCNLFQQRDHYVHTNACAILSNVSHGFPPDQPFMERALSQHDAALSVRRSASPRPGEPGGIIGMKLHPNVCLKLISLLTVLSKRYVKLMKRQHPAVTANVQNASVVGINLARPTPSIHTAFQSISHPSSPKDTSISSSSPDPSNELSTFSSFIRLIFDILLSALRGRNLHANTYLLYSLMQSVDILTPFKNDPLFWNHGGAELQSLCHDFNVRLEEAMKILYSHKTPAGNVAVTTGIISSTSNSESIHSNPSSSAMTHMMSSLSIDDILGILKQQVKQYHPTPAFASSVSDETRTNHFTYIEQERAEEFFIPYLWNLMYHVGDLIPFNEPMIVLFETKAEEESKKESSNTVAVSSGSAAPSDKLRQTSSFPSSDDTDVEGETVDDRENRRLATELEQIHFEHKLQQQVGAPTLDTKMTAANIDSQYHLFGPHSGVGLSATNSWISQNATAPLQPAAAEPNL